MEIIELQRSKLWKAQSFLKNLHGDFALDQIMEVFIIT